MNLRNLVICFLLLSVVGCADTYEKSVQVDAQMTAVEAEALEAISDFTTFKSRVTSDVEATFKYNVGKYEFIDNANIPYTTALELYKNKGKVKLTIMVSRDSTATSYFKVYLGQNLIKNTNLREGITQLKMYMEEMDKMNGVSENEVISAKLPDQEQNINDKSTVVEKTSPTIIGGLD